MEVVMKIARRELIMRLTAAGIGFALTAAVFRIAVAQSQEAAIVTPGTASGSYETQIGMKEPSWMVQLLPNKSLVRVSE
jgi:hypothetical protein